MSIKSNRIFYILINFYASINIKNIIFNIKL